MPFHLFFKICFICNTPSMFKQKERADETSGCGCTESSTSAAVPRLSQAAVNLARFSCRELDSRSGKFSLSAMCSWRPLDRMIYLALLACFTVHEDDSIRY